jgi:hypothetical protein
MAYSIELTDRAALLDDIDNDNVYQVRQRTATYAVNNRTGRRVTRDVKGAERAGFVQLTDRSHDGLTRLYDLTDAALARWTDAEERVL